MDLGYFRICNTNSVKFNSPKRQHKNSLQYVGYNDNTQNKQHFLINGVLSSFYLNSEYFKI